MPKPKTRPWDPAEHLADAEDMAAYLEAALEDGDPRVVAAALGDIARAKGMTQVARDSGLGRESLYKALSPDGNPELATLLNLSRNTIQNIEMGKNSTIDNLLKVAYHFDLLNEIHQGLQSLEKSQPDNSIPSFY